MPEAQRNKSLVQPLPVRWDSPVTDLPRITPAKARALAEAGLLTVGDLLRHYPRRHEDRRIFPAFPIVGGREPVCLRGTVAYVKASYFGRRCQFALTLKETDAPDAAQIQCRWFNLRYLPKILRAGQDLIIHGRPRELKKGGVVFDHPDFEVLEPDSPDNALVHLNRITPIHPGIGPWSPRMLRRLIHETLGNIDTEAIARLYPDVVEGNEDLSHALRAIHFPRSFDELEQARALLAREELFEMQCVLAQQRRRQTAGIAPAISRRSTLVATFLKSLPFSLTGAQKRVLARIFDDLESGHPMNRLLHGDVGSGKTIVAATAMLGAIAAGHSAALMAPTQVLAQQHYANFRKFFGPHGVPVSLRTSSQRGKGFPNEPGIVIGTQALLFAQGSIGSPALVVIDEQHKFGVRQRAGLSARKPQPHVLVMSATPIPRTLALTLYGDLNVSVLDDMPAGRMPVRTLVRAHNKLGEAAAFVRTQLDAGRQAYFVYPVIDESSRAALKAATVEYERWNELLAPHRCALLHGKLDAAEKESIMQSFRSGEISVLVSTTVIEVGIDVPNATVLLVENAERFGLAQLHQLRGRVGRGSAKSWCVLLAGKDAAEKLDRLKILEEAADGFAIAEADLAIRGPGDLLGTTQTGLPPIRLAELPRDLAILEDARKAARHILDADPDLSSHHALQARMLAWEHRLFAGVA